MPEVNLVPELLDYEVALPAEDEVVHLLVVWTAAGSSGSDAAFLHFPAPKPIQQLLRLTTAVVEVVHRLLLLILFFPLVGRVCVMQEQ